MLFNALWSFFGVDKKVVTETDRKLINLLDRYFAVVRDVAGVNYKEYNNIDQFIDAFASASQNNKFFGVWLKSFGKKTLKDIAELNFPSQSENLLDIIDYREFVLDQEIENGISDDLLTSITDSISFIYEELKESMKNLFTDYKVTLLGYKMILPNHSSCTVLSQSSALRTTFL